MENSGGIKAIDVWKSFQSQLSSIKAEISVNFSNKDSHFGEAEEKLMTTFRGQLSQLQKYITDNTSIMPAYDVRRTQELLDETYKELKHIEAEKKPKKKFSFGSRKSKDETLPVNPANALSAPMIVESKNLAPIFIPGSFLLKDKVDDTILLDSSDFADFGDVRAQILIQNCKNSTIAVKSLIGSVRIENSSGCLIVLGPCCTSTYMEHVDGCTIFTSCHQLRIHNSHKCSLYVRVNSHPIIEDCSDMGFAPYSILYGQIEADFEVANLSQAKCWENVVDFRWHRTTKSPNWHIIAHQARLQSIESNIIASGWSLASDNRHLATAELDTDGLASNNTKIVVEDEDEM